MLLSCICKNVPVPNEKRFYLLVLKREHKKRILFECKTKINTKLHLFSTFYSSFFVGLSQIFRLWFFLNRKYRRLCLRSTFEGVIFFDVLDDGDHLHIWLSSMWLWNFMTQMDISWILSLYNIHILNTFDKTFYEG